MVQVFEHEGKLYVKCSCCEREQHGWICGDIFAVFGGPPNPEDIVIRWHKCYHMYLNGNPELDKLFDDLVENEPPGVCLPCDSVEEFRPDLQVGACTTSHSKEYFESTLPKKEPKLHPGVK